MKIIIGWTGSRSRELAILLQDWLKRVIQAAEPRVVKIDEEGKESSFSDLLKEDSEYFGILCLTKENHQNHTILFEAGVLSSILPEERLSAVLLDIKEDAVSQPLKRLSLTTVGKEDIWKLVRAINEHIGIHALRRDVLEDSFDTFWDRFEYEAERIAHMPAESEVVKQKGKALKSVTSEPILIELLATVRTLESRLRSFGHEQPPIAEVSDVDVKPFQKSIESLILKMSKSSYSESSIIDFLKKIGIPESYARFTVHKTLGTGVHLELHKKTQ